jgi:hypothetical protein
MVLGRDVSLQIKPIIARWTATGVCAKQTACISAGGYALNILT